MKKAWASFNFFKKSLPFAVFLKRAWLFAKQAIAPKELDLSNFTKGS